MLPAMSVIDNFRQLSRSQRHTFVAAFLGWTQDSLDFFLLIFCVNAISIEFHTKPSAVLGAVFMTQAFRPVGALLFGMLADRFGRRPILMINIFSFSVIELACAFAPSLTVLLVLRALFGIAMGGEWGVGAALAFETLPKEGRGTFSGILQEGYAMGSILASSIRSVVSLDRVARVVHGRCGAGAAGVLCANAGGGVAGVACGFEGPSGAGCIACGGTNLPQPDGVSTHLSVPGAVDDGIHELLARDAGCVPTFLSVTAKLSPATVGLIGVLYGFGSIAGGFVFGTLSEKWGRKRAIVTAALLSIPVIPLYAYGHSAVTLGIGAVLMQFMVQGAWGVVPAYLTELSPAPVRATAPGLAYQLGGLVTSWNGKGQALAAERWGNYPLVLAVTVVVVALTLSALALLGREARGQDMAAL